VKTLFYDWGGANTWLFYTLNGWHNDVSDAVMQLGSLLGDHERFAVYLLALVLVAWWRVGRGDNAQRWFNVVVVFSAAYVLDGIIVGWLKHALDFPRPPAALPLESIHLGTPPEYRHSFPSGHAVFAMTCVASLWPLLPRAGHIAAVLFVFWVALSRVNLGVHFPADVVAGALLALAIVLGIRLTLDRVMRLTATKPLARARSARKSKRQ